MKDDSYGFDTELDEADFADAESEVEDHELPPLRTGQQKLPLEGLDSSSQAHAYFTRLTANKPCNKAFALAPDGKLEKESAADIGIGKLEVVPVSSLREFADHYRQIGNREDQCLILGWHPPQVANGATYDLTTDKKLKQREVLGKPPLPHTIARLKRNFRQSNVLLFDYDVKPDTPEYLRFDSYESWIAAMDRIIPGFAACEKMIVPSQTQRVRVDGEPVEAAGWHCYVWADQIVDPAELKTRIRWRSEAEGLFYESKNASGSKSNAYIVDISVFNPERIDFAGRPRIKNGNPRLSISEPAITFMGEGSLALDRTSIDKVVLDKLKSKFPDRRLERRRKRDGSFSRHRHEVKTDLKLTTRIEGENGDLTPWDFALSDDDHVRCQSPFRFSESQAAYLSRFKNGVPFVFDVGTDLIHTFPKEMCRNVESEIFERRVNAIRDDKDLTREERIDRLEKAWPRLLAPMDRSLYDKMIVHLTDIYNANGQTRGVKTRLKALLEREQRKIQLETELAADEDTGSGADDAESGITDEGFGSRAEIIYDRLNPRPGLVQIRDRLVESGDEYQTIYAQGDGEIYRIEFEIDKRTFDAVEGKAKVDPKACFEKYDAVTLSTRIGDCARLANPDGDPMEPTILIAEKLLREFRGRGFPLVGGIISRPTVTGKGRLILDPGYDETEEIYSDIPERFKASIPNDVSKTAALASTQWIIDNVFADFVFASDMDRDTAIAMLITAYTRPWYSIAPAFVVEAAEQRAGKSTLCSLVNQIAYGVQVKFRNWRSEEELSKSLPDDLGRGVRSIGIDNVTNGMSVSSDILSSIITEGFFKTRLLNTNKDIEVSARVMIYLNGIKISVTSDSNSRFLTIKLAPKIPFAERHHARDNLAVWVIENEIEIHRHILTILSSYYADAEGGLYKVDPSIPEPPTDGRTNSRFGGWGEQVNRIMLWLGLTDMRENFARNEATDLNDATTSFLLALYRLFGVREFTSRELYEKAYDLNNQFEEELAYAGQETEIIRRSDDDTDHEFIDQLNRILVDELKSGRLNNRVLADPRGIPKKLNKHTDITRKKLTLKVVGTEAQNSGGRHINCFRLEPEDGFDAAELDSEFKIVG